ncbi:MAG TPA: HDOD domain-containing protein [Gammaproteobacteria bacterium]|nr:HDOD domain-containing protein [Gammaproteobacteria bacterium]
MPDERRDSPPGIDRDDALRRVRNLPPLRHLSDPEFERLADATSVESCAPGADLFRAGRDDKSIFYLLSGLVVITDVEGQSFDVDGGSIECRYPLAPHPRTRIKATARTLTEYVRFPAELMQLQRENAGEDITVDEIGEGDERFDNKVLFDVYHALMSDELILPTLPDVALRIREAANDKSASVENVARVIQADASTAAYCISIANNAIHAGVAEIDNVLDAVVRMGIQPTRDVVVAYTIRSLFASKDPGSKQLMREAWKHSCRIAALSYILARDGARLNAERALLAGLLHDIGVTVLINEAGAYPTLLNDPDSFAELCRELSGQIGATVLRAWNFPEVFPAAALEAEFFAKPIADRLHLCDVVVLAHIHDQQPAPWSLPAAGLQDLPIQKALQTDDMAEDYGRVVIEQADRELAELTRLFGG